MPQKPVSGWAVDDIPDASPDAGRRDAKGGDGWAVDDIPDAGRTSQRADRHPSGREWTDLERQVLGLPPDKRSGFAKVFDVAATPLISDEAARRVSGAIAGTGTTQAPLRSGFFDVLDTLKAIPDVARLLVTEPVATIRGFGQGVAEGAIPQAGAAFVKAPLETSRAFLGGAVEGAAQLTSPLDLALFAANPAARWAVRAFVPAMKAAADAERAVVAARAAGRIADLPRLVNELAAARRVAGLAQAATGAVRAAERAATGGMVLRGAERIINAEAPGETGAGVAQVGFGLLGLKTGVPPLRASNLRVTEPPRLTGQVRPSFVASADGVVASPDVTIPMQPAPDGSFVRAVPGQYAQHEVRGLLRPGPAFVADDAGRVATLDDAARLSGGWSVADIPDAPKPIGKGRGKTKQPGEPVTVPARVMDREFSGAKVRREIFTSDPSVTADAPLVQLEPRERVGLQRILAELESGEFTKHTFNEVPRGRGGAQEIVPGGGGAPIFHDITEGVGGVTRGQLQEAIRNQLEGKHNAWGQRALEFVRRELKGDVGGQHSLPEDAGVRFPSLKGDLGDEDFQGFGAMLDDMNALGPTGEPGEGGFINAALLHHLGGGAAGAAAGTAAGDDPASRLKGAIVGGITGALLPSVVGRPGRAQLRGRLVKAPDGDLDPRVSGIAPAARPVQTPALDEAGRYLAETGAVTPALLGRLGSGTAGAVIGGATGDDLESRVQNAAIGFGLGLAAPSATKMIRGRLTRPAATGQPIRMANARMVGDAIPTTAPPKPGYVRMYHGGVDQAGGGPRWFSSDRNYAQAYADKSGGAVSYVDIPENHPSIVSEYPEQSISKGFHQNVELPADIAAQRKPIQGRPAPQPGTPMRDPMKGVDVFLDKFAPEFREGIKDVIEQNGGFQAQRRGTMPQDDVERLAQAVTVDVQRRIKPGTAFNTEAVRAHVDALAGVQSKINDLSARIARGQNTDVDILALEAAKAELSTLAASVMGGRSEAGRSLAQWKILARVIATNNPQLQGEAAQMLRGEAAAFAAQFAQLPADPVSQFRWLQQHRTPRLMERARHYYLSNILSGVKTHERNILGNLHNVISHLAVHPAAVGVDVVRSAVRGTPRTLYLSELPSQMVGAVAGLERGISEAMFSLRHGVNRSALTQSLSAAEAGKLDVPRVEFGGGGVNPLNWPGRALDSADQFFRAIARNMEAHGLAHAAAKREGRTGDAFQERMAELLAGVGDEGQRIAEKADAFARRMVFQEKAGPLVGHLQALSKRYPALSFVMPFIRTPANIMRQGAEFSPVGFAMKAARAGGREGAQAQARAALGTIASGGLAYLAATGRLSGSGPSDPIERAQLMESGWRPNSVRIGDQWVEYSLFQPVSVPAMAIANAFEAWRDSGMKDVDGGTKAGVAAVKTVRSLLNLSFVSGVADMFEAIEARSLEGTARWAGRVASGLVPFAGALRTVAQAMDPNVRQPRGFAEQIMTGIPGLSDNVPARMDRFGQDLTRPGGPLKRAADPFNVTRVNDDPVLAEFGRLGVRMGMPSGHIGGVELSREQGRNLEKLKGSAAYTLLERVVSSPGYARLSDEQKAEVLELAIDRARNQIQSAARKQIRGRLIQPGAR